MKRPHFARYLLAVILVALLSGPGFGKDASSGYTWPTDASHAITSSFGEYRPGHFHAGLDIKTWGKTGYRVFAVRDGYIWKVRVSPFGYGKVVYQVLDSGETAVYAHLSRFMPELERRVRRVQRKKLRYSTTLVFKPNQIPVRRGQVIAYTGDTGVGYPHLHFELRDAKNRPINPFLRGFRVADHKPPKISAVAIVPLASWSRVSADVAPRIQRVVARSGQRAAVGDTVEIWGPVYLGVLASDGTDGVRNRISVYSLRLYVDGELVYSSRYDRFSYSQTGLVDLDRDYRLRVRTRDIYYTLYVAPENTLPFYGDFGPGSGVIWAGVRIPRERRTDSWLDRLTGAHFVGTGLHEARVVAEDFAGNRSEVLLALHVVPPVQQIAELQRQRLHATAGSGQTGTDGSTRTLKLHLDRYETYARIVVTSDHPFLEVPAVSVDFGPEKQLESWLVDDTTAVVVWEYPDRRRVEARIHAEAEGVRAEKKVILFRLGARDRKPVEAQAGAAEVRFPPGTGYRTFFVTVERDTTWSANPDPMPFSTPVRIEPEDVPLRRRVELRYTASSWFHLPLRRLAWYYRGRDQWAYVGNMCDSTRRTVAAEVKGFGTFAVVVDTVPPVARILWPRDGSQLTKRTPTIRVRISDDLSGIGSEDDFEVLVDGQKQVAEWDPERQTLRCRPFEPLPLGAHTVSVHLRDRCGNETHESVTFTVVRRTHKRKKARGQARPLAPRPDSTNAVKSGSP